MTKRSPSSSLLPTGQADFIKVGILLLLMMPAHVYAKSWACDYLIYNHTAKSAGMANLDVVFPELSNSFWSPAAIVFKEKKEMSFDHIDIGGGEDGFHEGADGFRLFLPFEKIDLRPFEKIALSMGYWSHDVWVQTYDAGGYESDEIEWTSKLSTLGLGAKLHKNFALGFSFNNINEKLDEQSYSGAFPNISFLWAPGKFRFGAVGFSVGGKEELDGEKILNGGIFGIGYEGKKMSAGLKTQSGGDDTGLGLEYKLTRALIMRFGMHAPGGEGDFLSTFGLTVRMGKMDFDFAYQEHPFSEDKMNMQAGLSFRWGGEEKEKVREKAEKEALEAEKAEKEALEAEKAKKEEEKKEKAKPVELPEVPEGEKINVAVTDFEARAPLSQSEAAFISDFVRADIVTEGRFNVVDKNNMDKVLAEQGFQQTGCSSAECAVAIGKVLNVKMMIVGSCGQLLGKYIITLNVVSVESAKIIYSDDVSVADPDELRNNIRIMIEKFSRTVK